MRKLLCFLILTLLLAGCNGQEPPRTGYVERFIGYIYIVDNTLYIDRVELIAFDPVEIYPGIRYWLYNDIITVGPEDDLADQMPSGYYTRHLGADVLSFEITDETIFTFVDLNLHFGVNEDGNRLYLTTNPDEFLVYHYSNFPFDYAGVPLYRRIPYFITVRDGIVLNLTESFWLTM